MKPPSTKHFSLSEFRSPIYETDAAGHYVYRMVNGRKRARIVGWEDPPESVYPNIQRLMDNLEVIREAWGKPFTSTPAGGWRSRHANRAYRGRATGSRHQDGLAMDIKGGGKALYRLIRGLIRDGLIDEGGLALYRGYVHYDCRGTRARWGLPV